MKSKIIKSCLTTLFVTGAFGYFIYYIFIHYNNLPKLSWDLTIGLGLFGSVLLYCINNLLGGTIWYVLLKNYKANISWKEAVHIVSFSQFGKYLPGNIGQHVGRIVLAKAKKIPTATTLQTLFLESVILSVIGISVSILGFLTFRFDSLNDSRFLLVQLGVLVLVVLLLPKFLFFLLNKYAKEKVLRFTGGNRLTVPAVYVLSLVAFLYILTFVNLGIVLDLIARTVLSFPESHVFFLISAFSWSWILGYLAPGAPAGLGIREAILVTSLSSRYEPAIAIGLSVILRFVTTAGDGLIFLIAFFFRARLPKTKIDSISEP